MTRYVQIAILLVILVGCGKTSSDNTPEIISDNLKALGADISLLPNFEKAGAIYKDKDGNSVTPLPFFKDNGFNFVRVRLFVNPDLKSTACQDLAYVTDLCLKAKNQGFKLMLDFHYSDTWADPSKQFKPGEWINLSTTDLATKLYNYTKTTLESLKTQGIVPEMIQTGNEITPGMLWDTGRVSLWNDQWNTPDHWKSFADLLKNATKACREVCPIAKIVIQTERSGDAVATKNFYLKMAEYGIDYDVIGLSYYPFWHGSLTEVQKTINMAAVDFPQKPVMFVEIAYPFNDWGYPSDSLIPKPYPSTPDGQAAFLNAFISLIKKHNNVTGLFYWYPEETFSPNGGIYPKLHRGLFDNTTGRALPGLYLMKQFLTVP
jgi:arabinogalactan endo-1,4-beta-galactosidase